MSARPGFLDLTAHTRIAADEPYLLAARQLQERLRRVTGHEFALIPFAKARYGDISLADFPSAGPEGYRLEVDPAGVRIGAHDPAGAQWAMQSLLQLLPAAVYRRTPSAVQWQLPLCSITDRPRFRWRGAMLDVVRHFLTVGQVCRFIDLLAMHRMNVLHLHLTDDQGWRIEIRRYPRLTEVGGWRESSQVGTEPQSQDGRPHGGFYTQDDIREIVAYAAQRGITVVPEIELPGHVQAAIAAYPELGVTDEVVQPWTQWGINPHAINVEESTIQFFRDVFDEVIELFPSHYIGVGGDECLKDEWRESPRVQQLMAERGIPDEEALQSWIIGQISAHLASRGRALYGWDEILEGGLAAGALVASWRGTKGAIAAANAGHDVVMCPDIAAYLDYRQSDDPAEPIPVGIVLSTDDVYGFEPIPPELDADAAARVIGGQANIWTEHLDSARAVDYAVFPRLCAMAEVLWSTGPRDLEEFRVRLRDHLDRLDAVGVEYRRDDGPRPWQQRPGVAGHPLTREQREVLIAEMTSNIG